MPPRLPDDKRQAIADAIKAGGTCRGIAREHRVSTNLVRKIAAENGITDAWSRDQTQKATRARVVDMKAERAVLAAGLLDDARKLRERAWSEYQHPMNGPEGPEIISLKLPPLGEVRNAYTAIGIALDKHLAVQRHDADDQGGLAAVDQWLRGIAGG